MLVQYECEDCKRKYMVNGDLQQLKEENKLLVEVNNKLTRQLGAVKQALTDGP